MDRHQIKTAFESTATMAVVLNELMMKLYGEEWLDWDPLTVYMQLRDDYQCEPSSEAMDRLCAVQVLQVGPAFFTSLDSFLAICNSLNTGNPSFSMFNPITAAEAAWAITETSLIRDLLPFNYSIKKYVAVISKSEGVDLDEDSMSVLEHIISSADPSSNVVRDLYSEAAGVIADIRGMNDYVDEQLKDVASQFHKLGLDGELARLINTKDMEDALSS
jgi:hypothetical protein